ncbi:MAG: transposase [Phycisphaerae bacterium]
MARPTKLTPEVHAAIIEAIELGATYEHAAGYAGIDESTFYRWRNRGEAELARVGASPRRSVRKSEEPFVEFRKALKKAVGVAAVRWLRVLEEAASGKRDGQWQAAAWKLERRHPRDYGRFDRHDVTSGGEPIHVPWPACVVSSDDDDPPSGAA